MSATYLTDKAWGHGLATIAQDGTVLDAWFPEPAVGEAPKSDLQWFSPRELDELVGVDELRNVRTEVIRVEIELSNPVTSTQDAYLRLQLLSHQTARHARTYYTRRLDSLTRLFIPT